jgi:ankyrin repeat protein
LYGFQSKVLFANFLKFLPIDMEFYILLALIAFHLINAGVLPFRNNRQAIGIEDLPPELLGNIMQYLPLKEQKSLLMLGGSAIAFDDAYLRKFAKQFGIHAIDKLFELGQQYERKQQETEQFIRAVIKEMPAEFIPALINLYAHKREWEKVEFMLSNGVDPLLLRYSIKRASMRDNFHEDLVRLRELVGNHVDVDTIINTQLNVDELKELLAPHVPLGSIRIPLPQNPGINTIDGLLQWASNGGHLKIVELLLANGANVHAEDDFALRWASDGGRVEVVKVLLAHGANVHAKDDIALLWASKNGHFAVVKELLAHGANVHAEDDFALRWASWNGDVAVVKALFAHGANVHARNDEALRSASWNGYLELVKVLLAHGASPRFGWALRARLNGLNDIADLLQAKLGKLSKIGVFLITRLFPAKPASGV